MAQQSESRSLDKVIVRLPDGMRDQLKELAAEHNRSMNAEIVARLAEFEEMDERLYGTILDNEKLNAEITRLREIEKQFNEIKARFFNEEGRLNPVLTVSSGLLDRIQAAAKTSHRTVDAEATAALEIAFPPKTIDVDLLSHFLASLAGIGAHDGDKEYLDNINSALATVDHPWTVKAGWDGVIRFYPYASQPDDDQEMEQSETEKGDKDPHI
jgi:plasmid stability protein